ncbi:YkoF family thiamine/hydroxymethylpyrimidine-binding protein [Ruania alba]|uniref:YKOF-related Family n=1 Tax=Ruania alba TaxID=648782 RepID=A0A1H5MZL0_9MICO|nr:YkoF family thiamine/hydroxymethylpyrimidine-binding protein [Ruania alba]SEE93838.1 YKOF-related Family [Ruania alba]
MSHPSARAASAGPATDVGTQPAPDAYGTGARFSLHPMTDSFIDVILGALDAADTDGLTLTTDDVSTFVRGPENRLLSYLTETIAHAGRTGVHTVAHVLLSRGCPGEVACEVADGAAYAPEVPHPTAATGLQASAHWALYPLEDGANADHMAGIYAAIENAKQLGVYSGSEHYVTRLDGDLADVLAAVVAGWLLVGADVRHVATHVTVSLNSPTGGPR